VRYCLEFCEIGLHIFVRETNEGTLVAHLVAVVGRTEHCYALAIVIDRVTLFLHFMGPNKQLQIVLRQEGRGVVRAKAEAHAALGGGATFLGVRVYRYQKWKKRKMIM